MALSEFRIVDFRSIHDSGWLAAGPVTLLIGRNNSGKSAVLRALTMMQAGAEYDLSDQRLRANRGYLEFRFDQNPPRDRLEQSPTFSGDIPNGSTFRADFSEGSPYLNVRWPTNTGSDGSTVIAGFRNDRPRHYIAPIFARRRSDRYEDQVNSASANGVQVSDRQLTSRIFALSSGNHDHAKAYRSMFESIFGFSINTFLTDQGQQPGIPISSSEGILLDKMGDGIGAAVRIITELADSSGKLFLIEEPENDLHPEAISALLDIIAGSVPRNQFIVSTHSDVVLRRLGSIPEAQVYETYLDDSTELPTTHIAPVVGREARLQLLSQLGYEPDLPPGWLIFEESTAERVCREVLIPRFVPRLAQLRTISSLGASKIPSLFTDLHRVVLYAHLTGKYSQRAWVIVDNEPSGLEAVSKLRDSFPSWDPRHFSTFDGHNFEDYYPTRFRDEVQAAVSEKNWKSSRELKGRLAETVCSWVASDPTAALAELEVSAAGAITVLRRIEAQL